MRKNYTFILIFVLFIFFMIAFLGLDSGKGVATASDLNVTQNSIEPVNIDFSLDVGLDQYIANFNELSSFARPCYNGTRIESNGHFQNNNIIYLSAGGNNYTEVNGDDNIVRYIPKALFAAPGIHFDVLGDYGYYIKTVLSDSQNPILESTVILFEVNIAKTDGQDFILEIEVSPVFSMTYAYVTDGQYFYLKNIVNEQYAELT